MRVLVTGAGGFAGRHMVRLAADQGASVVGLGRTGPAEDAPVADFVTADLTEPEAAMSAVRETQPDRIFHLAALAHVGMSWSDPLTTLEGNFRGTVNLLEAVQEHAPDTRVLVAGSSEQYGPPEQLPVVEEAPFRPRNPYALSKCTADLAAGFYAHARGLHVLRTRSFNHAGPGQHESYVVSSFAHQIAAAEAEGRDAVVVLTGDTRPRRDFTDVRDVVRAYWLLLEHGQPMAYNVCSGRTLSVADILAGLARLTDLPVEQRTDPSLLRDNEVMEISGVHERLTDATGWQPEVPIERTLGDALDHWRAVLARKVAT